MKIMFTTEGQDWNAAMDPRFGRAAWLLVFDEESDSLEAIDNSTNRNATGGAGPQTARIAVEKEVRVLITGNGPGGSAGGVLKQAGIRVYTGAADKTIRQALDAYRAGELTAFEL